MGTQTHTAGAVQFKGLGAPAITTFAAAEDINQRALSPSQVNTWLGCNAAWMFRSLWKLPDPPNVALAIGRAVDETVSAVLRAPKPQDQGDPSEVEEHRQRHMAMALEHIGKATDRALAEVPDDVMGDDKPEDVKALTRRMIVAVLPTLETIRPLAVQESVTGEIAGVPLNAIIDIREEDRITDLKTAANRPTSFGGADVRQLATYAHLSKEPTVRRITITKRKVAVIEQLLSPVQVTREVDHLVKLYPLVREQMASGLYAPNREHNYCSKTQCSFWRACQKEFGGSVPD